VLIDRFLPRWHVRSCHEIAVHASPEATFAALRSADLAAHPVVRALLASRAFIAAPTVARWREVRARAARAFTIADFEKQGFGILADSPPHELVMGLEGAFWKRDGELRPVRAGTFMDAVPTGLARAAWSFKVRPVSATDCVLATETRVLIGGDNARRRFRVYWLCIGWASGLIRRLMLRSIRSEAERRDGASGQHATPGAARR
jgi:hypothetical protein